MARYVLKRGRGLWGKRRIGLLGGSFSPAHWGHVGLSLLAYKHLSLDEVWWLVAPDHPFKQGVLTDYELRCRTAESLVLPFKQIRVCDLRAFISRGRGGASYPVIAALREHGRGKQFVFLLGADIASELPHWYRWSAFVEKIPLAIFDRGFYTYKALFGQFASRYRQYRKLPHCSYGLPFCHPPAWIFFNCFPRFDMSSTHLRRQANAFC